MCVIFNSSDSVSIFARLTEILSNIQSIVFVLSLLIEFWTVVTNLPGGEALFPLMDSFRDLLNSVAVGLSQMTDIIRLGLRVKNLFSFFFSDSFRAVYDR